DAFFGEGVEGEWDDEGGVGVRRAGERGVDVGEAQGFFGAFAAEEDRRRGEARVMEEEACELGASVAGDAGDGDAEIVARTDPTLPLRVEGGAPGVLHRIGVWLRQ